MLTEYETTLVVRPDIGADAIESTLDRVREAVRAGEGKLLAINHWGKKKLAFPIKKHNRAIYVHTQYLGNGALVSELERNLRIADSVLRYLTVKVDTNVDPSARQEIEYVVPQYEAEEAVEETPAEVVEAAKEEGRETAPKEATEAAEHAGEAVETAPVETAPAETAPAETAPVETAPAEAAPAETAPAEAAPAEAAPAEAAPAETAPAETAQDVDSVQETSKEEPSTDAKSGDEQ